MLKVRLIVCALGAVSLLATAGCSSSGTSSPDSLAPSTSSTPSNSAVVSKADFITQADAICAAGDAATKEIAEPATDPTKVTAADLPGLAAYFKASAPIAAEEIAKLKALPAPAPDVATLEPMLAKVSNMADQFATAAQTATNGDLDGFQMAIKTILADGTDASTIAADYGFTVCGN